MTPRPRRLRALRGLPLLALLAAPMAAHGQTAAEPAPVVVAREIRLGAKPLRYTVETGRVAIRDVETGEPHGYMFYTAYRVTSPGKPRPVTFVWNGGPGADSTWLHFSVTGPKRVENGHLVDNADTWLGASDLVLVDPIGTGFSRPTKPEYSQAFYGTVGDVASVTEFVRAWRVLHEADDAPLFLAGESWGAGRAASVAYALERRGVTVDGLVLISGGAGLVKDYGSKSLRTALRVVDMASTAFYHGKIPPALGGDVGSVRKAAEAWARQTYAPALERLDSLTPEEREALAIDLANHIGLPPQVIDRKTLTVSPRQFRTQLLKAKGQDLYVFDMRLTASPASEANGQAILRYFRRDLGYRTDLPYVGIDAPQAGFAPSGHYPAGVGERWDYATEEVSPEARHAAMAAAMASGSGPPRLGAPLPGVEDALALNPRLRVLVVAGLYDSFMPCAENVELASQLPPNLAAAMRFKCYEGGHAIYKDAAARAQFSHDVEALIEKAP